MGLPTCENGNPAVDRLTSQIRTPIKIFHRIIRGCFDPQNLRPALPVLLRRPPDLFASRPSPPHLYLLVMAFLLCVCARVLCVLQVVPSLMFAFAPRRRAWLKFESSKTERGWPGGPFCLCRQDDSAVLPSVAGIWGKGSGGEGGG